MSSVRKLILFSMFFDSKLVFEPFFFWVSVKDHIHDLLFPFISVSLLLEVDGGRLPHKSEIIESYGILKLFLNLAMYCQWKMI